MKTRKTNTLIASFVINFGMLVLSSIAADMDDRQEAYRNTAEKMGCLEEYRRGKEILRKLSSRGRDEQKKLDIGAYRGNRVAFVGGAAPPGATNDLMIEHGYYLRVLSPKGKDMRPHSVWWEVLVCGKVLQVLPENKIIVIDVAENGWWLIQTG